MRDMIPPGDRSIRNIPIPAGHRHIPQQEIPEYYQPEPAPQKQGRIKRKRRPGRFILWALGIIVVCAGAVAGISMLYAGASVVVVPRTQAVNAASTTLVAQINAPVGILSYNKISATRYATTTVPATGTKKVSRQASGTVTISSTYSANQRLISGTRLEAPDGKIYRLGSSVDLPANGKVTTTVSAESPGESYNRTSPTTFTLPGFKGDPRYEKFSATSQGAIQGGFVGDEPAVATADLELARAELKAQLDNATQRELDQSIPETDSAIPGTLSMVYGDLVQSASADKKTATLSQSATASGATVGQRDLASALARKLVEGYAGEAIDFMEQDTLSVTAATTTKPTDEQLTLILGGETTLVWQFDPNKLREAMLGKDKSTFESILGTFAPAIASATATIKPFWIKNFPQDPEQIEITIDVGR